MIKSFFIHNLHSDEIFIEKTTTGQIYWANIDSVCGNFVRV